MPTTAADVSAALFSTLLRAAGLALLIVGAGLALMFAFAAALVVGLLILGAAAALRFFPAKRGAGEPGVLDARQTPDGWVVEGQKR
ncbi:MAG TPA: hypothetical protein PLS69_10780 [Terricaulis sp.]|nr:hypothetical protein [Terricaulis sp.]